MKNLSEREQAIVIVSRSAALVAIFFVVIATILINVMMSPRVSSVPAVTLITQVTSQPTEFLEDTSWVAPSESTIPTGKFGKKIRYGKELVVNTAKYLGPKGSVAQIANVMNCQNCHIEAGTRPFAFNFAAVKATYPQFKARSNSYVSIEERINGCFERSLNGSKLAITSKEMLAMVAYIEWLGKDVNKGVKPKNNGIIKLAFLDRAADPIKGKVVYVEKCKSCHGNTRIYPPLWGKDSYNDGAGLYRISNFAGFVKSNMPFGTTYQHPLLTDEQAWDVAAFVNSQPRPHKDQKDDWEDLSKKPIDFPYGPYADGFSERQHKYGPFNEIIKAQSKMK